MASIGQLEKSGKKLAAKLSKKFGVKVDIDVFRSGKGMGEWGASNIEITVESSNFFKIFTCYANGYPGMGEYEFSNITEMKKSILSHIEN